MISNDDLRQYLESLHYETAEILGSVFEQTLFNQIAKDSVLLSWLLSQIPEINIGGYQYKKNNAWLQRTGPNIKRKQVISEWS